MKRSVCLVDRDAPGRPFIMPKPSGEGLRDDLAHLRMPGISVLASLLEAEETRETGLGDERRVCEGPGMGFRAAPIPDLRPPEAESLVAPALDIAARLDDGAGAAAHCRAGVGGAGMAARGAMAGRGLSAEEAVAPVSRARAVAAPDASDQAASVARTAAGVTAGASG